MARGGRIDLGSQHLRATAADGVLRVVIDRPARRNALTIEMYHGLKKAAVLAERDDAVDVLLVTASGDTFCVGGEMGGQHEGGQPLDRETDGFDLLPFVQFERCPKIVLLAVDGMCQGGGLNMVLMSDLAVASTRATFRAPELLRGVADCFLGARLVSRVGIARAKFLLFAAQPFTADEALAMGLVARVVPGGNRLGGVPTFASLRTAASMRRPTAQAPACPTSPSLACLIIDTVGAGTYDSCPMTAHTDAWRKTHGSPVVAADGGRAGERRGRCELKTRRRA